MKKNSKKINKVKKEKIKAIVFKILFTVSVSALLILWAVLNIFAYYDNIFSCLLNVSLTLLVFLLIVLAIWKEKFRTFKVFIVILIAFFIRIGHGYYYDVLSMKFEPLMHLKIKYGFEFKDMQIIESYKASAGFITPPTDRGAKIKYKDGKIIYVYYSNSGWKDNYEAIVQSNKVNSIIYDKFSSVVKKYSDTYKIVEDLQVVGDYEEAGYDYSLLVFLYSQDSDINENIIKELDVYVKDYEELYLSYGLFITKDLDFYNKLINEDISKLNTIYTGTSGQTSPEDLFEHVKYDYERITYNHDGYSKKVFINNGNKSDDEYKNPKHFNNILFYYQSERNSFVGANSTDFVVFGVNE